MKAGAAEVRPLRAAPKTPFDVAAVRRDFPILSTTVHGKPLIYLDNAATTQKPRAVIDAVSRFYETENSNVHRGIHWLSQQATFSYERSRGRIARFLGVADPHEVLFVRGTTEGINLVAFACAWHRLKPGDEVIISTMEHHSNIVPWQMVCGDRGAKLKVVPIGDDGSFLFDAYERLLSDRTKFVAVGHVSNALGTVNPVARITEAAKRRGAIVVIDGAQAVQHLHVDVTKIGCDFYAFSGHKVYAPTGVGALWGRMELLESMPPWQGGGDMIASVSFEKTTYNKVPHKFEAGTPDIAGAVGLEAAIDYLERVGRDRIAAYEADLLEYGTRALSGVPGLRLIGTAKEKSSVLSFVLGDVHPHDVGTILDREGIAVRAGHHCAQPVMDRFGVPATTRASLAFYNTRAEIDALAAALKGVVKVFGR